jgi:hypothetical protein
MEYISVILVIAVVQQRVPPLGARLRIEPGTLPGRYIAAGKAKRRTII